MFVCTCVEGGIYKHKCLVLNRARFLLVIYGTRCISILPCKRMAGGGGGGVINHGTRKDMGAGWAVIPTRRGRGNLAILIALGTPVFVYVPCSRSNTLYV